MKQSSLLFLSLILLSAPSLSSANEMTVTPKTCATAGNELPCKMQVSVHYSTHEQQDLCLWLVGSQTPLKCFLRETEIDELISLVLNENTAIELRDMTSNVLAFTLIEVAVYHPAPKRKRRGLNWDLL